MNKELRMAEMKKFKTHKDGSQPGERQTFVFGSNLAGRHGAGAAKAALRYGAKYGLGVGPSGTTYAIPTKDSNIETIPLKTIELYIEQFANFMSVTWTLEYLTGVPEDEMAEFFLTRVGCGLAGYTDAQVAPIFAKHLRTFDNIDIPEEWLPYFEKAANDSAMQNPE